MTINIAKLRQFSVGSIIFSFLIIGFIVLGVLGSLHVFMRAADISEMLLNPKGFWIVDSSSGKTVVYNYELSIYILASSFSMLFIVLCFWLFFSIKNLQISKDIDLQIKSDLKVLSIVNFFTLCIGSIMQLATCDEIIEKYRKLKRDGTFDKTNKEIKKINHNS